MNVSKEQWTRIATIAISAVLAILAVLGWVLPVAPPIPVSSQGLSTGSYKCNYALGASGNQNCYQANNGYDLSLYSDDGATRKFTVDGATGNAVVSGTLTVIGATTLTGGSGSGGNVSAPYITSTTQLTSPLIYAQNATVWNGLSAKYLTATVALSALDAAVTNGLSATYITGTLSGNSAGVHSGNASGAYITATTQLTTPSVLAQDVAVTSGLSAAYITATTQLVPAKIKPSSAGSAANATYCMSGDCDTGFWYQGDNIIGIATGGVERGRWTNAGLNVTDLTATTITATNIISTSVTFSSASDGTAAAPAYTFTSDPNSGLYSIADNSVGLSTNGVLAFSASATAVTSALPLKGAAEGSVTYATSHDVSAADINAGHTLVTVPASRVLRIYRLDATAYGGTCTTSTDVFAKIGATTVTTYSVAALVRSTLLQLSSGSTILPDGGTFGPGGAGDDLTVISNSADTAGCTGVRFSVLYSLE